MNKEKQEVRTDVKALKNLTIKQIREITRSKDVDPDKASDNILRDVNRRLLK